MPLAPSAIGRLHHQATNVVLVGTPTTGGAPSPPPAARQKLSRHHPVDAEVLDRAHRPSSPPRRRWRRTRKYPAHTTGQRWSHTLAGDISGPKTPLSRARGGIAHRVRPGPTLAGWSKPRWSTAIGPLGSPAVTAQDVADFSTVRASCVDRDDSSPPVRLPEVRSLSVRSAARAGVNWRTSVEGFRIGRGVVALQEAFTFCVRRAVLVDADGSQPSGRGTSP